jgi:DNA-binding CsgD family transcriptional regulator
VAGGAGDAVGLDDHMGRALGMATGPDRRAARCEVLAAYALECARLGIEASDEALLARAASLAREARALATELPGRPPWGSQADAAEATALWQTGERGKAAGLAKAALAYRRDALREDAHLEILVPAARVLFACGEEAEMIEATRDELSVLGGLISQRTVDPEIRARWWAGPVGRALAELVEVPAVRVDEAADAAPAPQATPEDQRLMALLVEGRTDAEIADELGETPERVGQLLSALYVRMGARGRVDATVLALTGQL